MRVPSPLEWLKLHVSKSICLSVLIVVEHIHKTLPAAAVAAYMFPYYDCCNKIKCLTYHQLNQHAFAWMPWIGHNYLVSWIMLSTLRFALAYTQNLSSLVFLYTLHRTIISALSVISKLIQSRCDMQLMYDFFLSFFSKLKPGAIKLDSLLDCQQNCHKWQFAQRLVSVYKQIDIKTLLVDSQIFTNCKQNNNKQQQQQHNSAWINRRPQLMLNLLQFSTFSKCC